ncbi:hypothetical protein [Streptomyces sp. NPDC003036]|uniref:hypothetical protein n=1 Tax=Streptomyces sp. NPDC003036 TaxID=3154442 RepID=UPI0033BC402C
MTTGQKTIILFVTVIAALLVTILGLYQRWPGWAWPAAAAVLCLAPALAIRAGSRNPEPFPPGTLPDPDLPIPPVERRELRVCDVALPSAEQDYDFLFSATVRWCPLEPSAESPTVNAGGLAVEAILNRARSVTASRAPSASTFIQHELAGALATMHPDESGQLQAMALDVSLVLSKDDQERLDKLAAVRKDEAVWAHERKYEQSRRAYLGEDVLKDTGSAVVWWLHKNDDQVARTVQDIGLLAQLTSASKNEHVAEPFRHLVPDAAPDPGSGSFEGDRSGASPAPPETEAGTEASARAPEDVLAEFLDAAGFSPADAEYFFLGAQAAENLEQLKPDVAAAIRRRFDDTPAPHTEPVPPQPQPFSMNGHASMTGDASGLGDAPH